MVTPNPNTPATKLIPTRTLPKSEGLIIPDYNMSTTHQPSFSLISQCKLLFVCLGDHVGLERLWPIEVFVTNFTIIVHRV